MFTPRLCRLPALLGALFLPGTLAAQAAVDPSVAPRAAAMARAGDRMEATEMLGRYLATAPDDGAAWLELGRFYLLDSREWHRRGHHGEPSGSLFLDLAATAMDESLRLPTDSGRLLRALVEVDRSALAVEEQGWGVQRTEGIPAHPVDPPSYVVEVGRNLVNSCPMGGVLVAGTDLEAVAAWSVVLQAHRRTDLLLFLPGLYDSDSLYRGRMAAALEIDPVSPAAEALTRTAAHRPVCLSPAADPAVAPRLPLTVIRLVRVAGPGAEVSAEPLSIIDLTAAWHTRPAGLPRDVAEVYLRAARFNRVLCSSLLSPLGVRDRDACGR
jgi:hypothetical protein